MGQFQTYPEDAQDEQCVWVAFARYDTWYEDHGDSGRASYVTTSEEDAQRVYDTWCWGGFDPDVYTFSVRRGFVRSYPWFDHPELVEVLQCSDDISWSDDLDDMFR